MNGGDAGHNLAARVRRWNPDNAEREIERKKEGVDGTYGFLTLERSTGGTHVDGEAAERNTAAALRVTGLLWLERWRRCALGMDMGAAHARLHCIGVQAWCARQNRDGFGCSGGDLFPPVESGLSTRGKG
jgi:hypothetical protein